MLLSEAEEAGFWNAIAEAPQDEVTRLVFADWLEERDDPRGPLLRERRYWQHLTQECRDPVRVILGILDASPTHADKPLRQAAALAGAPLVPGLLERCRAARPSCDSGAAELLAALAPDCLLPILPDLIDLLPRHADALAPGLARLGPAAVAAVPALLEAERTRALDRRTFAETIAAIGPSAHSPEVVARLVAALCADTSYEGRAAIAKALAVVGMPCLEAVLGYVLERAPAHFSTLAWHLVPETQARTASDEPSTSLVPAPLRAALGSADERARWGAACALARVSLPEALPLLLDALRRAPTPLLQPVVMALQWSEQKATEALPLLRELLGRPELPFAESVARALLAVSGDPAGEAVGRLGDANPLVRQRIVHGITHDVTKDERGRHALVHALLDPDPGVRRAAADYCTRYIFLSSWEDQAALAPLRQALDDPDPRVRAGAASALRHLHRHAAPAEPDLLALLRDDPDAEVRRSAGRSLATLEYETQAIFAGLEAGLDDPDEEVRRTCAWGLCHWDSMTAERVRIVLRRLGRVDRGLREFLAFAVCRSQAALPEVVAFLHGALRQEEGGWPLRSAAAVALGRLRVEAALTDLFAFLDSGGEEGAEALCRLGPAAVPGLIARLRQGSARMRELLLCRAADFQGSHPHLADLLPGVLACLRHEDEEVRRAALRVLQGCQRRSAAGARLVEDMIRQERDRETRCDAIGVLARLSPHPRAAAATLAELQRDREATVRAAVPRALEHLGLSAKAELELLRVALGDAAEEVRTAAVWRAAALGPAAAPLLPDLLRILDGLDREDWCRRWVIRALEALGAAAAAALEALRAEDSSGRR
jgi:uncharacterized protein (TIGR02996 family)